MPVKRRRQSVIPWKARKKLKAGLSYSKKKFSKPKMYPRKSISSSNPRTSGSGYGPGAVSTFRATKHVRTGYRKKVYVSSKLKRAVKHIAKTEISKEAPRVKIFSNLASTFNSFNGFVTSYFRTFNPPSAVPEGSQTTDLGIVPEFVIMDAASLLGIVKTLCSVTAANSVVSKFNVVKAVKQITIYNNTTRHIEIGAVEFTYKSNSSTIDPVSDFNNFIGDLGTNNAVPGVRPTWSPQWKNVYNSTCTDVTIAPGGSYTHSISCYDQDVDFQNWIETTPTTVVGALAKVTKGVFFILSNRPISSVETTNVGGTFQALDSSSASLTVNVKTYYTVTVPSNAPDDKQFDQYQFKAYQVIPTSTFSVFDRTAQALAGTV